MRWVTRLLSVISIATLARLLEKDDFGLVALASAFVALPAILTDLGVEQAVISERAPDRGLYNTAWTIRAAQLATAALLIYLSAPWVAAFYGDTRIVAIVQSLSVMVLLKGLENMWTVSFRKEFNFKRDFVYDTLSKLLTVVATISLAVTLRSYWALIYGQIVGGAVRVVISFCIAPEWPRPTLSHWRRIWSFSQWSLAKGAATYLVQNGDRVVLGRLTAAGSVGAYSIGREIAEMPLTEIAMPVNRALGPGFSALQHDPNRLVVALTKSLAAVVMVALPIGIGLALTAEQLIPVFLGPRWQEAVPVLQLLSIASTITAVRGVMGNTLAVIGHIRSSAIVMWIRCLLLVVIGVPAAVVAGANGMAVAFLVAEILTTGATLYFYRRHLPQFSLTSLWRTLLRPVSGTLVMTGLVLAADQMWTSSNVLLLVTKVAIGALSYGLVIYLLWHRSGHPEGVEQLVAQRIRLMRKAG